MDEGKFAMTYWEQVVQNFRYKQDRCVRSWGNFYHAIKTGCPQDRTKQFEPGGSVFRYIDFAPNVSSADMDRVYIVLFETNPTTYLRYSNYLSTVPLLKLVFEYKGIPIIADQAL